MAPRPANNPPETLIGRRISEIAFAVYAAPDVIARHGRSENLKAYRWLAPGRHPERIQRRTADEVALPGADIVLRADSPVTPRQAAIAGSASLHCPAISRDNTPGLVAAAALSRSHQWQRRCGPDPRRPAPHGARQRLRGIHQQSAQRPDARIV